MVLHSFYIVMLMATHVQVLSLRCDIIRLVPHESAAELCHPTSFSSSSFPWKQHHGLFLTSKRCFVWQLVDGRAFYFEPEHFPNVSAFGGKRSVKSLCARTSTGSDLLTTPACGKVGGKGFDSLIWIREKIQNKKDIPPSGRYWNHQVS